MMLEGSAYGWTLWVVIAGMALVTYFNRAGPLIFSGRFVLPPSWQAALKYAPASALAAIAIPELFAPAGSIDLSLGNPRLYAGFIGLAVAALLRSTLGGIAAGMLALHALQLARQGF
ncbi:MAG: AzlD domain-containing protein [Burkholderiales bacterium]|nr:AzlD domain-containing protein [Burkholderiales bacterium]